MTLQQIKYFIEIANSGSISRAADSLFIAQPSLSNAVKDLETEIGVQLFLRTPKGINLTDDGAEFLGYARQIAEQTSLLEQRYLNKPESRRLCAVSSQHYAFVVRAFANMVGKTTSDEYEFTLRETRTFEIIEDVRNARSEIGVLYTSPFNEKVIHKFLREKRLEFTPLFSAKPHIFTGKNSLLAAKRSVTLEDLEEYPFLSYEQGNFNSFYFAEELQSTVYHRKALKVCDRATMFNLMIALSGYTVCSGLINADLNGEDIVAIPLEVNDSMTVGYITNAGGGAGVSVAGKLFVDELMNVVKEYGHSL
jgi:DNA-binding transcriptional LysR family regulator